MAIKKYWEKIIAIRIKKACWGFEMTYQNIKKDSPVDTYQDNLFLAVSDMFWDMITRSNIKEKEAREIIIRDVKDVIDESLRQAREDDIR